MTPNQIILFIVMLLVILVQAYKICKLKKDSMTLNDYLSNSIDEAKKAMNEYNKVEVIEIDYSQAVV